MSEHTRPKYTKLLRSNANARSKFLICLDIDGKEAKKFGRVTIWRDVSEKAAMEIFDFVTKRLSKDKQK